MYQENGRNHIEDEEIRVEEVEEDFEENVQDLRLAEMRQMRLEMHRAREPPRLQIHVNGRGQPAVGPPRMFDPDIPRLFRRRWYRPLLPFESVLDIFNASPYLERVK